eukprot:3312232-Rhodomonas_salina.3
MNQDYQKFSALLLAIFSQNFEIEKLGAVLSIVSRHPYHDDTVVQPGRFAGSPELMLRNRHCGALGTRSRRPGHWQSTRGLPRGLRSRCPTDS